MPRDGVRVGKVHPVRRDDQQLLEGDIIWEDPIVAAIPKMAWLGLGLGLDRVLLRGDSCLVNQ